MNSMKPSPIKRIEAMGTGLLALALLLLPGQTLAQPHHGGGRLGPHRHRAVRVLPRRHVPVKVGPRTVYRHRGMFYKKAPAGFLMITAPIGAVLGSLPVGFSVVTHGGSTYFTFGGVFYRRCPRGYVVVDSPAGYQSRRYTSIEEGEKIRVTVGVLNVRSGPSVRYGVIDQAFRGTRLTVLDRDREWLYVRLPGGNVGWIMGRYTRGLLPDARG